MQHTVLRLPPYAATTYPRVLTFWFCPFYTYLHPHAYACYAPTTLHYATAVATRCYTTDFTAIHVAVPRGRVYRVWDAVRGALAHFTFFC